MDIFKNKLVLAPMAGITEKVFRTICKNSGADVLVSEMVSCEGYLRGGDATKSLATFDQHERPFGVQIFGADPETMGRAAATIQEYTSPDFIDINAGCPVPKVVNRNGGSALLKDRKLFEKILSTVVKSVTVPVTVKIRSGWHTHDWVDIEFARAAEGCGVGAVALHPRSRAMVFSGHSFWDRITEVKKVLSIPLIGNGDITSPAKAIEMYQKTGCDSIMIGRAALGNPWLFADIKNAMAGVPLTRITNAARIDAAIEHFNSYCALYGDGKAFREMKKHLAWYCKGLSGVAQLRNSIFRANSYDALITILLELKSIHTIVPDES